MVEILFITTGLTTENGLKYIYDFLQSSYSVAEASYKEPLASDPKIIITNIPEVVKEYSQKTFYVCTERNTDMLDNLSFRRKLAYNLQNASEVFVFSHQAQAIFKNYLRIPSSVQHPCIPIQQWSEKRVLLYKNISKDVLREFSSNHEIKELNSFDDLKAAKLLIYKPRYPEFFNIAIQLAGACGVPTIVENVGCIPEFVSRADTLLSVNSTSKQWIESIKVAMRDINSRSDDAKKTSSRFNNLSQIDSKIQKKLGSNKVKTSNLPSMASNLFQREVLERQEKHRQEKMKVVGRKQKVIRKDVVDLNFDNEAIDAGVKIQELPMQPYTGDSVFDVSVIVPLFKSRKVIEDQIQSWDLGDDGLKKEIIYVDDSCPEQSGDAVTQAWQDRAEIGVTAKVIKCPKNKGFGIACNIGAKYAKGKYLVFLNADCKVTPNWIKPMYDLIISNKEIGIVGNMQLKGDTIDSAGSEWDWGTKSFVHIGRNIYHGKKLPRPIRLDTAPADLLTVQEREMVTGCCFMISKEVFDNVSGFDARYKIGYWEDADLNMKVRLKGLKIFYQPDSKVHHKGGHSGAGGHHFMNSNTKLFYSKWVESKLLETLIKDIKNVKKVGSLIPKEKIVVYTAITGGYDSLKEQQVTDDIDFVAFTDVAHDSNIWQFKPAYNKFVDHNRNAKIHKILPHLYFPDKEYSLWIDGSITLKTSVQNIIETYMPNDVDMLIFKHPERKCLYAEAETCLNMKLDNLTVIKEQIMRYKKEGYPLNNGLVEATVILRRHTEKVKLFNEAWWDEIQKGSKRDQISFNYVAKKLGFVYQTFPGSLRANRPDATPLFEKNSHNKRRR